MFFVSSLVWSWQLTRKKHPGLIERQRRAENQENKRTPNLHEKQYASLKHVLCNENDGTARTTRMLRQNTAPLEQESQTETTKQAITLFARPRKNDTPIRSIVVIGSGIAGTAAAGQVRRLHPDSEVRIIAEESDTSYRACGARQIHGREAIRGVSGHLDTWCQEQRISAHLNTHVAEIDTDKRRVTLATGTRLGYDRLILANGSSAQLPSLEGIDAAGSFVLSDLSDVKGLRGFVRHHGSRTAIVAGVGLLSLEVAYSLQKMGLKVSVLLNADRVFDRQLDVRSSGLMRHYYERQGIDILTGVKATAVITDQTGRVRAVRLKDGSELPTDIFLVCTDVRPNVELAKAAGIATRHGILVDDYMQTSQADVYAAGDVAEHDGVTSCLAPYADEQGKIAAINALGGQHPYGGHMPSTLLQASGIDLLSVGQFNADGKGMYAIVSEQPGHFKYRKLILASGHLLGAILIGYPEEAALVSSLVKRCVDLTPVIPALLRGNWDVLAQLEMVA